MSELVDLVDANGNIKVTAIPIEDAKSHYPEGLYLQVAVAVVFDGARRILVERRSQDKKTEKGEIDLVCGVVSSGEDPKATAERETFEETGITTKDLLPVHQRLNSYNRYRYLFMGEAATTKIKVDSREVESAEFADLDELRTRETTGEKFVQEFFEDTELALNFLRKTENQTIDAQQILNFLHETEKLKTVLRHSWLSSGRRESVAEHSWRLGLMAIMIAPKLEKSIDLSKTLKLVLVHDLGEVHAPDFWAFNKQPDNKAELERQGLIKLTALAPPDLGAEILELWEEYEAAQTPEAKFAKFLDKAEVLLQHNEADIKHLTKKEIPLNLHYGKETCEHDSFLRMFRKLMDAETIKHYKKHKVDPERYSDYI